MRLGFKLRIFMVIFVLVLLGVTVGVILEKPSMHKPFQLNIIEYIIKINRDGSVTSTKSTTTTVIQEDK